MSQTWTNPPRYRAPRVVVEQLDLLAAIAYTEPGAQLDLAEEAGVERVGPSTVVLAALALLPLEV